MLQKYFPILKKKPVFLMVLFITLNTICFGQLVDDGEYRVLFNDSIIASFDFNSSDCVIDFKSDSIHPTDKLVVEFVAGKRCSTCKQTVEIKDEKRRKVGAMYPSPDKKKMTCIIGRLKEISQSMQSETLYFFYSDEESHVNTILLKVRIKP